ncbi:MAG: M20/M25/M40 family metallo-hydrolase [Actinomycetales bacterium]|nr:M20/M25/M40 family metallo-hydrolase [Actinomycetales bacterium]
MTDRDASPADRDASPAAALARLRALVRIPTVSRDDPAAVDAAAFARFREALAELYPRVHAQLELESVERDGLLFRWPGGDPSNAPAGGPSVLMAHQDVVPADEPGWQHGAFDGAVTGAGAERRLHGRGAIDDKGSLAGILEATEALLAEGHRPRGDVYLFFGADEEVAGTCAEAAVRTLEARGATPALVLDEGGAVVEGVFPGVSDPIAVIGVSEKGIASVELLAEAPGGHASTPVAGGATARLARAVLALDASPAPARLNAPTLRMIETLAPHVRGALRPILGSARRLRGPLARMFARLGPETAAMVRTTRAVTRLRGSAADNVIAERASAIVNVRVAVGSSLEEALGEIRRVVERHGVTARLVSGDEPSPVSPDSGPAWEVLTASIAEVFPAAVATPYVMLQASDARHFARVSRGVYRFLPFDLSRAEREHLHAIDESIRASTFANAVRFYAALLRRL